MGSALPHINVPSSAEAYEAALEGLTALDELILKQRVLPPLYKAGVKYRNQPHEVWRHADDVARERWGDCEDLSGYRAAELRLSGEDPQARIAVYKTGGHMFHAVVRRGSGVIEDPSRVLGMPIRDLAKYRAKQQRAFPDATIEGEQLPAVRVGGDLVMGDVDGPEIIIGEDDGSGSDRSLSFDIYHTGRGWSGVIRLPLLDGRAMFLKTSATPEGGGSGPMPEVSAKLKAIAKSSRLATLALQNPALKALIPPQAALALNVLQSPAASAAIKAGAAAAKKLKFW